MLNAEMLRETTAPLAGSMERCGPERAGQAWRAQCSACSMQNLCLPRGIQPGDLKLIDELVYTQRRVKRGQTLIEAGDPFRNLYGLRSGFLKSFVSAEDGREQVIGFHMAGDIVGFEGIDSDRHSRTLTALEDSEVCIVLFHNLERTAARVPALQRQFYRMMSREIVREQGLMMLLGAMSAEERMAAFLLNLSRRFAARGFSQHEFNLRMTREEIGSYLGLTLETVSRGFSRFQERGLIDIKQRRVKLLDMNLLERTAGGRKGDTAN